MCWREEHECERCGRSDGKARRRCQSCLHRTCRGALRDAEFVQRMRSQGVLGNELLGDLASKTSLNAPGHINLGEFCLFKLRVLCEFLFFTGEVRMLGVGLRTDRNILSRCHGHRAGNKASYPCQQHIVLGGCCRGYSQDQARRRDDPIICAEYGGPKPSNSFDKMFLLMRATHGLALICWIAASSTGYASAKWHHRILDLIYHAAMNRSI